MKEGISTPPGSAWLDERAARRAAELKAAEATEALHFALARALDIAEPLEAPAGEPQHEAFFALAEEAVAAAVAAGGHALSRTRPDVLTPEAFLELRASAPDAWAVSADRGEAIVQALGAAAPDAAVLPWAEAALRIATKFPLDPRRARAPLTPELLPQHVIVVLASGPALGGQVMRAFAKQSGVCVLAPIPNGLLTPLKEKRLSFDDWLGAALEAAGYPGAAVLRIDYDTLTLMHRHAQNNRCPILRNMMTHASVLLATWSDKPLGWAHEQVVALRKSVAFLSRQDTQMILQSYREHLRQNRVLERLCASPALFKHARRTKLYVEISTHADIADAVSPAELNLAGQPAEPLFSRLDDQRAADIADHIRAAVDDVLRENARPASPASALVRIARAQERADRYKAALTSYREALSIAPQDPAIRATVVKYLELTGRIEEAERALREGLASSGVREQAVRDLRDFYRRHEATEKEMAAARLMRRANHAAAPMSLAAAAVKCGKPQMAMEALQHLDAEASAAPWSQRVHAVAAAQLALPALQERAQATGAAPDLLALAEALRLAGDAAAAKAAYEAAVAADGNILSEIVGPERGPDFLVVGPPRTATTLLRRLLELHAGIGLTEGESQFLTNRQPMTLAAIADMVAQVRRMRPDAQLIGDKSPQHFALSDDAVAMAASLFPHAKIIITTRHPVARAWSAIKLFGYARVVDAKIAAMLGEGYLPPWLEEIVDNSRYLTHIGKWVRHFGRQRVLLVQTETLERNVVAGCNRIYRWLGLSVPPAEEIETLQQTWSNRTLSYPLHPALEDLLERKCGGEIYRASELDAALEAARHEFTDAER